MKLERKFVKWSGKASIRHKQRRALRNRSFCVLPIPSKHTSRYIAAAWTSAATTMSYSSLTVCLAKPSSTPINDSLKPLMAISFTAKWICFGRNMQAFDVPKGSAQWRATVCSGGLNFRITSLLWPTPFCLEQRARSDTRDRSPVTTTSFFAANWLRRFFLLLGRGAVVSTSLWPW